MGKATLGNTYRDKITGVAGVAIGRVEHITGCNQVLVQPRAESGKPDMPASYWIDEQRLEHVPARGRVELDNGTTPGPCAEPPRI